MAQRFNRAMEIMGWRVPADSDEVFDDMDASESDIREFKLHTYPGGQMDEDIEVAPPARAVHRIITMHPTSFREVQEIGESFRKGIPVIINLAELSEVEARRVLDFAAGLSFGLHGAIEKVAGRVFLLSPKNIEVTSSSRAQANALFS